MSKRGEEGKRWQWGALWSLRDWENQIWLSARVRSQSQMELSIRTNFLLSGPPDNEATFSSPPSPFFLSPPLLNFQMRFDQLALILCKVFYCLTFRASKPCFTNPHSEFILLFNPNASTHCLPIRCLCMPSECRSPSCGDLSYVHNGLELHLELNWRRASYQPQTKP